MEDPAQGTGLQQAPYYSVTDLRMMARALGFPSDSLESCLPSGFISEKGISSKELSRMLDLGYFTPPLHFTFNMKSGLYNVKLILKCLDLLDRGSLSYADIQEARLAFSAYEHLDQKGVRSELNILLKVIKMSGFAMSPQKLSVYLKQKKPTYVEKGRVQLYEYLDMLSVCEPRNTFSIQDKRIKSTDKTSRGVYQMDDVRASTLTPDEKLVRHLNRRFQHVDSWKLPPETSIVTDCHSFNKFQKTAHLNGTRPQTTPSKGNFSSFTKEDSWTIVTPVPQLRCRCSTPKRVSPILSEQDVKNTQNSIKDLLYQMETLDERSRWDLNWRLDYYLPGYRERSASKNKNQGKPQPVQSLKKITSKEDVFQRLSTPKRRIPSPCHAMTCDAFKLGIPNKTLQERLERTRK